MSALVSATIVVDDVPAFQALIRKAVFYTGFLGRGGNIFLVHT